MNKFIITMLCFTATLLGCRNLQSDFDVKVVIINESEIIYDSVSVTVFPDKREIFYNVKPKDTLVKIFEYRNYSYPKGEHGALGVGAFKDDYFYSCPYGLIDPPYALLSERYNFYIWENGITPSKDIKPRGEFATKYKISDFPK